MFEEEYRKIEGYDNYSVSNLGNVRNDKTGRIMKGFADRLQYLLINLRKENKRKTHLIHRLVASAFLPNTDNLPDIDHINQIKTDNQIENLRWCSRSNNMRNIKKREGLTSNFQGVSFDKESNKWRACISINKKCKYLGRFETEDQAHEAWCNVVRENNLQEFYGL